MFQGRYGNDHLNRALGFTAIGVALVTMFLRYDSPVRYACTAVSTICIAVLLFRMFSRNFAARASENAKFLAWWNPLKAKFGSYRAGGSRARTARQNPTFEERRKYKYFICPQCAQRLRVPRGKGKLRVTCTRCGNKFEIKS